MKKIIESIIRNRLSEKIIYQQNPYQRGFTKNVSPLHAALIIEEITRECRDQKEAVDIVFLDAKAAFDLVDHNHLLRRLYHCGIDIGH